jgi:hypothetical protein
MKKKDLKKLALLGITGVAVVSQGSLLADVSTNMNANTTLAHSCGGQGKCSGHSSPKGSGVIADADDYSRGTSSTAQTMTEDQLRSQLNSTSKEEFDRLDREGKRTALKLASRSCKGNNDCKGQNSCKTSEHSCAGKGSCAGTSACNFKDKNAAVKVAKQLQDKRGQTNSGSY